MAAMGLRPKESSSVNDFSSHENVNGKNCIIDYVVNRKFEL